MLSAFAFAITPSVPVTNGAVALWQVETAVSGFVRVLKPAGGLCISVLPNETSHKGSCHTRVPRTVFAALAPEMAVVGLEEMDDWGLPHGFGRYSVCLRKAGTRQQGGKDLPVFDTIKDTATAVRGSGIPKACRRSAR